MSSFLLIFKLNSQDSIKTQIFSSTNIAIEHLNNIARSMGRPDHKDIFQSSDTFAVVIYGTNIVWSHNRRIEMSL